MRLSLTKLTSWEVSLLGSKGICCLEAKKVGCPLGGLSRVSIDRGKTGPLLAWVFHFGRVVSRFTSMTIHILKPSSVPRLRSESEGEVSRDSDYKILFSLNMLFLAAYLRTDFYLKGETYDKNQHEFISHRIIGFDFK